AGLKGIAVNVGGVLGALCQVRVRVTAAAIRGRRCRQPHKERLVFRADSARRTSVGSSAPAAACAAWRCRSIAANTDRRRMLLRRMPGVPGDSDKGKRPGLAKRNRYGAMRRSKG